MVSDMRMGWLTDWDEARQKPARTIVASALVVLVCFAPVDYYLAGTHSLTSALGIGGICGAMVGLVISRHLWPQIFDRPLTSGRPSRVGRAALRWSFVAICLLIGLALAVYGLRHGSVQVAASGLPFVAIAGALGYAKRWVRRHLRE